MKTYEHLSQLIEARSVPTLYHATNSWKKILLDGELMAFGITGEERRHVPEEIRRRYGNNYISFARSMGSSYVNHVISGNYSHGAVLEFDTKALRNKYKLIPVDYFKDKNAFGKTVTLKVSGHFEMEERLITSRAHIPIEPYLVAVHMVDPFIRYKNSVHEYEKYVSSVSAVISKFERDLAQAEKDGNEEMIKDIKGDIHHHETLLRNYEASEAHAGYELEHELREFRKYTNAHPKVPFYLYKTHKEMKTGRFSLARQANSHLPDHDDIDEDDD